MFKTFNLWCAGSKVSVKYKCDLFFFKGFVFKRNLNPCMQIPSVIKCVCIHKSKCFWTHTVISDGQDCVSIIQRTTDSDLIRTWEESCVMCVLAHFWSSLCVVSVVIWSVFIFYSIILERDKIIWCFYIQKVYGNNGLFIRLLFIIIAFMYNHIL